MIDTQINDGVWDIKIDSTTDKGLVYNVVSKNEKEGFKMNENFLVV